MQKFALQHRGDIWQLCHPAVKVFEMACRKYTLAKEYFQCLLDTIEKKRESHEYFLQSSDQIQAFVAFLKLKPVAFPFSDSTYAHAYDARRHVYAHGYVPSSYAYAHDHHGCGS